VIKCVIWDLDNTLLAGVYLESPDRPPPANPALAGVLAELAGRGILQAIASRNPPEAAQYAEQVTGHHFAASRCDWGAKPASIRAIMAELGLPADAVAFVDDDALERAEVSFSVPGALVLAPDEMTGATGWPQFSPPVVTDEARRRGEIYLQRRARQAEASAFGGSRDDFLRQAGTRVAIRPASDADLPRLHELSVRTHQFNSAGAVVSQAAFAGLLGSAGRKVITAWLSDRYGDDGMVGGCVITPARAWEVALLMMSCRAMGRGVIDAMLAWICRAALDGGAEAVRLPCVINPRNVPLRIALTGAGFRAEAGTAQPEAPNLVARAVARTAVYVRRLDEPLPAIPEWVTA
jgi:methoxymalonate biosynthesis protein